MLAACSQDYPLLSYYKAYYQNCLEKEKNQETSTGISSDVKALLEQAEKAVPDYCFPNKLEDIVVLKFAIQQGCLAKAAYYLGNLFYDKLQWEQSIASWDTVSIHGRAEKEKLLHSILWPFWKWRSQH